MEHPIPKPIRWTHLGSVYHNDRILSRMEALVYSRFPHHGATPSNYLQGTGHPKGNLIQFVIISVSKTVGMLTNGSTENHPGH